MKMKNDIVAKVKSILGWGGAAILAFWTLCLLAVGNPISAVITLVLAFLISPLRKNVFDRFNIGLKGKKLAFTIGFFFLSSCGTFLGLTEVEEASEQSQLRVESVEEIKATDEGELLTSEKEALEKDSSKVEEVSESEDSEELLSENEQPTAEKKQDGDSVSNDVGASIAGKSEQADVEKTETSYDVMQVHFIDVGQGDATLITCGDEAMLIDAGDNSKGTTVQLYLKKQGIDKLEYLVLTHPDADHIGGADVVVSKFDVDTVFMSEFTKDNKTYNELISALNYKGLSWSTPNVGNTYTLGSAEFTIIAPNTTYSDPNNSSIGLILRNGENGFLFTGDAEEEAEYDILANGLDIECDVYKAGHHGSKTASTKELIELASPEYVVVSCGEDNSYGHPHAEPMNLFRSKGMQLFRTDEQGSIIATADGKDITWNCAPTDSWKAGENTQSSSTTKPVTTTTKQAVSTQITEKSATQAAQTSQVVAEPVEQPQNVSEPAPTPESQIIAEPEPQVITAPEPEPEPTPAPVQDVMVWKTKSGKKYHSRNDCGSTDSSKATQITRAQAEAEGLGPCSKCW